MLDPIVGHLAVQQTRDLAHSARPDAPVRDDLAATAERPLRRRAAVALHRLADRLEPIPTVSTGTR
jgi:hypothetical protein